MRQEDLMIAKMRADQQRRRLNRTEICWKSVVIIVAFLGTLCFMAVVL